MADKKFTELPAVATPTNLDIFACVQAGETRRVTRGQLLDFDYNHISFDTTPTIPDYAEGQMYWDEDDKTLLIRTDLEDVSLQVGQEQHVRAINKTGVELPNGTIVYVDTASGNRPVIAKASATSSVHARAVLGITTHNIGDNETGYVTTFGLVRDVDTLGMGNGSTLFLSTTAGGYTSTAPTAPDQRVKIGTVLNDHQTQGIILFSCHRSPDLNELSDVHFASIADGDHLVWNAGASRWEEYSKSAGGYYWSAQGEAAVAVSGTYVKVTTASSTTSTRAEDFTVSTDNRLTYTGTRTKTFVVTYSLTMTTETTGIAGLRIAKNGSTLASSEIHRRVNTPTDEGAVPVKDFVELATGDYVELWATNTTGTGDVYIEHGTCVVVEE